MAQTLLKVKNLEKFIKKHGEDPSLSGYVFAYRPSSFGFL